MGHEVLRAADDLNTAWDAVVAGRADAQSGLAPDLVQWIDGLHVAARRLEPSDGFLSGLERRLEARTGRSPSHLLPVPPLSAAQRRPVGIGRGRQSRSAVLGSAAMVLLTLSAVIMVFRGGSGQRVGPASSPNVGSISADFSATPDPSDPVRFDECNAPPLPTGHIERLEGSAPELPPEAASAARVGIESTLYGLSELPSASEEALADIRLALRRLTACSLYDGEHYSDENRYGTLLTDDYHRRLLAEGVGRGVHSWRPSPNEPPTIIDTRVLADGRVLVEFADEIPFQVPGRYNGYHEVTAVFALVEGDWLLDAIVDLDFRDRPGWVFDPWSGRRGTFELVLVAAAPGYVPFPDPGFGPSFFMTGGTIRFILYNITGEQRRFFIPELRIDVTVPPYETRAVDLPDSAGEHSFRTYTGDSPDRTAPCDGPYPANTLTIYATPPADSRPIDVSACPRG